MIRQLAIVLVVSAATAVSGAPLAGQTELRILVVDSATAAPLEGARIELVGPDGTSVWQGLSATGGQVSARVGAGRLSVITIMVGYRAVGPVAIDVPAQDWLQLRILMPPEPVALDPLDVDVARRSWPRARDRWGFEWRRSRRPFGEFVERGDERLVGSPTLSSLFRRISGFSVQDRYTGNPVVYLRGSRRLRVDGSFTVCGPALIVDGSVAATGGPGAPVEIDDHVRMNEIVAMEIYRSAAEVPPEFRGGQNTCGAIVIWTY